MFYGVVLFLLGVGKSGVEVFLCQDLLVCVTILMGKSP
jgi:hypothetical protein